MDLRKLTDIILAVEQKIPPATWQIDGVCVWPIIKTKLAFTLEKYSESDSQPSKSISVNPLMGFAKFVNRLAFYLVRIPFKPIEKRDYVFLTHSTCFYKIGKHYFDIFGDSIDRLYLQPRRLTMLLLEYAPNSEIRIPKYTSVYPIDFPILLSKKISNFLHRKVSIDREQINRNLFDLNALLFEQGITTKFGFLNERWVLNKFLMIRHYKYYFKKILEKASPKAAFVVTYYNDFGFAFTLACHEMGIEVIDIQHGVQGNFHHAYGSWNNIPSVGYKLLPSKFWTWREEDAKSINKWAAKSGGCHEAFVGGNAWTTLWRVSRKKNFDFLNQLTIPDNLNSGRFHIVVTMQPHYFDDFDQILNIKNKVSPNIYWWVRIHPSMVKQMKNLQRKYSQIVNFNIKDATNLPLPTLLSRINLNLTANSSTVIEASEYNVPSIVTHHFALKLYSYELENNRATFCPSESDIITAIEKYYINWKKSGDLPIHNIYYEDRFEREIAKNIGLG